MLRNYAYSAGGQGFAAVVAVLAIAIITRTLGPADYGSYIVLTTFVTLAAIFVGAGPQAAALVLSAREPNRQAELHGQILLVAIVLTLVTIAVALVFVEPIARGIAPTLPPELISLSLLRLPATFYTAMVTSQLSGAGRIGLVSSQTVALALISLLGPVGALLAADSLAGVIVGTLLAAYVSAALAFGLGRRALGLRRPQSFAAWRSALALAVPTHIGTTAYWVMLRLDLFVVGAVLGRHDAGLYGLALGVSQRVGMITTPLYNAAAWRVSGPDRAVALRTMFQLLRLELAFGIIAAIGGLVFAPFVIQIVSGSAYAEAAGPLAILIVGAAALPMWGAVGLYVLAHLGGAWTTARLQLLVAAGSAVGYVVLVPVAGMIGAAAVSTLAYLVLLGTGLALIRRVTPFALRDLAPTPEIARVRAMLGRGRIAGAPSDEGSGEDPAS